MKTDYQSLRLIMESIEQTRNELRRFNGVCNSESMEVYSRLQNLYGQIKLSEIGPMIDTAEELEKKNAS